MFPYGFYKRSVRSVYFNIKVKNTKCFTLKAGSLFHTFVRSRQYTQVLNILNLFEINID